MCVCTYVCMITGHDLRFMYLRISNEYNTMAKEFLYHLRNVPFVEKNRQDDNVENRREKMEWTIPNAVVLVNNSAWY